MGCMGIVGSQCRDWDNNYNTIKNNNTTKEFSVHFEKITDVKDFVIQARILPLKT